MSRPSFNPNDRAQSPFSQSSQQGAGGAQVPNFKTNVNRNKTRKWAEAKNVNYDGDDWGGFDPYDEYGNYDGSAEANQAQHLRQHSFDKGEERRAFSAGVGPPQSLYPQGQGPQPGYNVRPRTSSQGSRDSRDAASRREFSQPAQVPAPLHMRPGQPRQPPSEQLPLRTADDPSIDSGKPAPSIPFIRPSDIYKRMEQEREKERQSLDSSRPSIDSNSSRRTGADSTHNRGQSTSPHPPLPSHTQPAVATASQHDQYPPQLAQPAGHSTATSSGLQSVVDRAFEPSDDTPSSGTSSAQHDLSRSNTDSTAGVSPIMSRVPSDAQGDARGRTGNSNVDRVSTITEEVPSPTNLPLSAGETIATSTGPFVPGHRRDLSSPHASPARAPKIETTERRLSQPMQAEIAQQPKDEEPASASSVYSSDPYNQGAADPAILRTPSKPISSEATKSPTHATPTPLKPTQSRGSTPLASPVNGRTSPFPGRVRDLADKYNEIHESRRNSQTSLTSKGSFSSWSKNGESLKMKRTGTGESSAQVSEWDDSAVQSPVETTSPERDRPLLQPHASFRPSLPGEWISTTDINAMASVRAPEDPARKMSAPGETEHLDKDLPKTPRLSAQPSDVDLTPTARSGTTGESDKTTSASSAIDAVKAAGTALGASLLQTHGTTHESRDFASAGGSAPQPVIHEPAESKHAVGDVYLKPLEFTRSASSLGTSVAPTPPAKDTPRVDAPTPQEHYFGEPSETRSSLSDDDEQNESDRLRRDIVRSLTPSVPDMRNHDATKAAHAREADVSQPLDSAAIPKDNAQHDKPDLLGPRFSWENKPTPFFNPSGLGPEVDLPQTDLRVINPGSPIESPVAEVSPIDNIHQRQESAASLKPENIDDRLNSPISPVTMTGARDDVLSEKEVSPVTDRRPSFEPGEFNEKPMPAEPSPTAGGQAINAGGDTSGRIPPFREILALTSPAVRIQSYNNARDQFSSMNTGLQDWISTTIAAHPEHNHLSSGGTDIIPGVPATGTIRHKPGQSIVKLAKGLGGKSEDPSSPSPMAGGPGSTPTRRVSNNFASHSPQASVNVEKMQAMGKDLLSSAGKFGGKSVVGAKGLFAKGRQKLRDGSSGGGGGSGDKSRPQPIENTRSVTPSVASIATTERTRASSPALSDHRIAATSKSRPPVVHKRSSSAWSSNRLSMTFDRIRGSSSEKPRSRSRPQSLTLPNRAGTPGILDLDKIPLDDIIVQESPGRKRSVSEADNVKLPSTWVPSWEQAPPRTPTFSPSFSDGTFRLGVLPSPGIEGFAGSLLGSEDRTPVEGSPRKFGGVMNDPAAITGRLEHVGQPLSPIAQASPVNDSQPGVLQSSPSLGEQAIERDLANPEVESSTNRTSVTPPAFETVESEGAGNAGSALNRGSTAETLTSSKQQPSEHTALCDLPQNPDGTIVEARQHTQDSDQLVSKDNAAKDKAQLDEVIPDKKDTPMLLSPEIMFSRHEPVPDNDNTSGEWQGINAQISHDKLHATDEDAKRSSALTLSTNGHSQHSDISLGSEMTVEQPEKVEIVRVASPQPIIVSGRSSLPSQRGTRSGAASPQASSPQATPLRELDSMILDRGIVDSPTVPEHLTPHATLFPPEMYESDTTPYTTPGDEYERYDYLDNQPRAPTLMQAVQQWSRPPMDEQVASAGSPKDHAREPVAQDELYQLSRDTPLTEAGPREVLDLTPTNESSDHHPPLPGADAAYPDYENYQHDSQMQIHTPHDFTSPSDFPTPPSNYRGSSQIAPTSSLPGEPDFYGGYRDDALTEMSPQEAAVANREELFRQATEQRLTGVRPPYDLPQGSRYGKMPPWNNRPGEYRANVSQSTYPAQAPSRLEGTISPPLEPERTSSISRGSIVGSALGFNGNTSLSKGKLIKKDRRGSVQRASSVMSPSPQPEKDKKKRFSGLGSLFRRSNSSASTIMEAPKRNRLSKQGPMIVSSPRQRLPEKVPEPPGYQHPPIPSEQASLADDNMHPRSMAPLSRRGSSATAVSGGAEPHFQSRNSWYGRPESGNYASGSQQPTIPNIQPTRQLHSSRPAAAAKRHSFADVAEEQPITHLGSYGQSFEQTIPPPHSNMQGGPLGGSPNRPRMQQMRHSSGGSGLYSQQQQQRGFPTPATSLSGQSPRRNLSAYQEQRQATIGQVSANQPPPAWSDYGGYYIPQNEKVGHHSPHRQSGSEQIPGMQSRHSSQEYLPSASGRNTRRNSTLQTLGGQEQDQHQHDSGNAYAGHAPSNPGYGDNTYQPDISRRSSQPDNGQYYSGRRYSPPKNVPHQQNEYIPQQNQQRAGPHYIDSDLYDNNSNRLSAQDPRQPRRLVTDLREGQGHSGRSSEDGRAQMSPTSYPGQEWTPLGVEEGRYEWE